MIAQGTLDVAGISTFLHGFDLISMQAWYEVAFGGYRLMVVEDDLELAVEVLRDARRNPVRDGERLVRRHFIVVALLPVLSLFTLGWLPFFPYREYDWHETGDAD